MYNEFLQWLTWKKCVLSAGKNFQSLKKLRRRQFTVLWLA
jgi:hypothetical protein